MKIKRIKNNKMKILSGLIIWQLSHPGQLACWHCNTGILANGTVILLCNCACWTSMSLLASYFSQWNFALEQNDPPINWFFPLKVREVSSAENVSELQITQPKKIRAPASEMIGLRAPRKKIRGSRDPPSPHSLRPWFINTKFLLTELFYLKRWLPLSLLFVFHFLRFQLLLC